MVNEDIFKDTFNDLFDVAHPDALTMITIPEDKAFIGPAGERTSGDDVWCRCFSGKERESQGKEA